MCIFKILFQLFISHGVNRGREFRIHLFSPSHSQSHSQCWPLALAASKHEFPPIKLINGVRDFLSKICTIFSPFPFLNSTPLLFALGHTLHSLNIYIRIYVYVYICIFVRSFLLFIDYNESLVRFRGI